MSFGNYLEEAVIKHCFKGTALTQPTNLYVALFTTDPAEDASGTEVTGGSYARKLHNSWDFDGQVGGAYQASNNGAVTFATATANWGTVTHFAIFDALSAGNMYAYGALDTSKAVNNGDTAEFADAALKITLN